MEWGWPGDSGLTDNSIVAIVMDPRVPRSLSKPFDAAHLSALQVTHHQEPWLGGFHSVGEMPWLFPELSAKAAGATGFQLAGSSKIARRLVP